MKKIFTYACAACFTMTAFAQDPATWQNGQNVSEEVGFKALQAVDEDIDNPVWQGFQYKATATEWEFRDGSGGERDDYRSWGVYNIGTWNVYQDITVPAGIYKVQVAGCYREGATQTTFDKWINGKVTENCFIYAKVGEKVYESPMMYMFAGAQEEALFPYDGWQNDCSFTNAKNGKTYYGPSCHWGADKYLENGNYNYNSVRFVVPEKTTVRVGIDKRVAQTQDQGWWNDWKLIYDQPYNAAVADALILCDKYEILKDAAESFKDDVLDTYPTLGNLMNDELSEFLDDTDVDLNTPVADIEKAIADLTAIHESNQSALAKTKTMEYVIDVCKGILKVTDYSGKDAFQAAITNAETVLKDADNTDATVADYIKAADELAAARVAYLLTQDKDEAGAVDLTHAISNPWFVDQEYTPTFRDGEYKFPQEVEEQWYSGISPDDECNLEIVNKSKLQEGQDESEAIDLIAISKNAHWSVDPTDESRWVYQDKWNGWHGGMQNNVVKLKGYAAFYSGWAAGANAQGGMIVSQVVSNLPEGFYTMEGLVWTQADGYEGEAANQYMFLNEEDGTQAIKVMNPNTAQNSFWSVWNRSWWAHLTTDFVQLKGGKVTLGFHHNAMAANAGVVLKYYGKAIDYTSIIQKKVQENAPAEGTLWPADQKAYDAIVAKIVYPIEGVNAYNEALAYANQAADFKKAAETADAKSNDLNAKYDVLKAEHDNADEAAMIEVAQLYLVALGSNEKDSYKDLEPATATYNAYVNYLRKYDEALTYTEDEVKSAVNTQTVDLKTNYPSAETLVAYERALSTPINKVIFTQNGWDKATEAAPVDITKNLVANPSFAEGPKTGWTLEVADPGINTYGRENAECWNQDPFKIYQSLRSLPAGTYEISVRACYRDGGSVDADMVKRAQNGEGLNAHLFAQSSNGGYASKPVVSTASGEWTSPSFDVWYNAQRAAEEYVNAGFVKNWNNVVCILAEEMDGLKARGLDDDALAAIDTVTIGQADQPEAIFDTEVEIDGVKYYYPASMAGFYYRIQKSPEAYVNTIQIHIEEGEDITFGFNKIAAVGSDWLIFDDFEVRYLGANISTGVTTVKSDNNMNSDVILLNGAKVSSPVKGINIINGKKVYVK